MGEVEKEKRLWKRFYHSEDKVGIQFRKILQNYVSPEYRVLNFGCGSDGWLHLKRKCQQVVGVDIDSSALRNPDLDLCIIGDLETADVPGRYDLAVSTYVVEHLKNPYKCFQHLSQVLKKGGILLLLTPNIFHYATISSKVTPDGFHKWFLRNKEEKRFPTYYRANRPGKLVKMLTGLGFRVVKLQMAEGPPDYLSFSAPTFLLGVGYERTVNAFKQLGFLRSSIMLVAEKVGD